MRHGAASYHLKRVITTHALERLRERADRDVKAMSQQQLRHLLDSVVDEAIDAGRVENIIDDGMPSMLVDLAHALNLKVFAVVRDSAVITILTPPQVDNNRVAGKWKRPDGKAMSMATIGDKLPQLAKIEIGPAAGSLVETWKRMAARKAPPDPITRWKALPAKHRDEVIESLRADYESWALQSHIDDEYFNEGVLRAEATKLAIEALGGSVAQ